MTELAFIDNLHFLRPGWFFLLIPCALITLIQWRSGDLGRQWQGVIAPHLSLIHISEPTRPTT